MSIDPNRAQELFLHALELSDADRHALLDRECAEDVELRRRVEQLLQAHDEPDSFLHQPSNNLEITLDSDPGMSPPVSDPSSAQTVDPDPKSPIATAVDYKGRFERGYVIGDRYTLQQQIGEGGMGEVWVAKQTEPVKRKVALKLVKTGMDSKAVLQRFEQERQALAMMDHPNIARVLDGGMTATGQPFFVMELVNGLPLTKFCDDAKLTPKERLKLFVPICQAVQHAHQKGIVHRDLKPANILLTLIDGKPVPKVIDFGVAKAIGGKLTDESMSTQFGAVVGTLEYMSPEQAGFAGEDIDTRADIFSLGVILYELLTGLRPIDATRLKKAAFTEMIRIIKEEEPSKPSTRLSTDDALPSLAAVRQMEPRKLMALLRGELDWVVLKCLEKQRDRRYETANALARDIERYLADEPVEARPPSTSYRLGKFLRRNRAAVMTVCAVAAALVLGALLATWQAVRATRAEAEERTAKEKAEKLATDNAKLAKEEAKLRKQAVAEKNRADRERHVAETAKYAMQLKLAGLDYDRFQIRSALQTLENTKPELRGWEYNRLALLCNTRMRVFAEDQPYTCVAISPDGNLVAGGSRQSVRVWDFDTRRLEKELKGDASPVEAVTFSPDGKLLATLTKNSVYVWDVASFKEVGRTKLDAPANPLPSFGPPQMVFGPKSKRIAVAHGGIQVWNASLSKVVLSLKSELGAAETGGYTAVAFDPQGERLAAQLTIQSPGKGIRKIWEEEYLLLDATTGKRLATSGRETRLTPWAAPVGFDPNGKWFFASGEGGLTLRDAATAKVQRKTNFGIGTSVALSADGNTMVLLTPVALSAEIHKLPELEPLPPLPVGSIFNRPKGIGMSADGRRVVAATRGFMSTGSVVGWTLEQDDATVTVTEVERPRGVSGITSNSKAGWLAVGISETEPVDREKLLKLRGKYRPKQFSYVEFRSLKTGKLLFSLPKMEGRIWLMQCSRDGKTLCTANTNNSIRIWGVANRKLKHEITVAGPDVPFSAIASLSTDAAAKHVCATIEERAKKDSRIRIIVWDTATGKTVWQTEWDNEAPSTGGISSRNSCLLSPAGDQLVVIRGSFKRGPEDPETGSFRGIISSKLKLYDLANNKLLAQRDFKRTVSAIFSYSGKHIYLNGDGIVRWNPANGEQTRVSDQYFKTLLVSPDDRRLIALQMPLGRPGAIHWFDPDTQQLVYQVPNEKMRYSPKGVHLTGDSQSLILTDGRKVLMLRSQHTDSQESRRGLRAKTKHDRK